MKKVRGKSGPPADKGQVRLEVGQKLQDDEARIGVVLDFASQYSHPKAPPVYSYLVRWDDGQVHAISEAALSGSSGGLKPVD